MIAEPTKRFSDRVENYVKYRPGYPPQAIDFLAQEFGLSSISIVADVGSGTGIFTKCLLDKVYHVYAVEPNEPMRLAAEHDLKHNPKFTSIPGTAEHTNLPAGSIDLITSATAFHWFNLAETRIEFQRILKPSGAIALIWNAKKRNADPFSIAYKALTEKYTTETDEKAGILNGDRLKAFFANGEYKTTTYPNQQTFDEEGLIGRALSSSYAPLPETAEGQAFLKELKAIFKQYQTNNKINFYYDTIIYTGKV